MAPLLRPFVGFGFTFKSIFSVNSRSSGRAFQRHISPGCIDYRTRLGERWPAISNERGRAQRVKGFQFGRRADRDGSRVYRTSS